MRFRRPVFLGCIGLALSSSASGCAATRARVTHSPLSPPVAEHLVLEAAPAARGLRAPVSLPGSEDAYAEPGGRGGPAGPAARSSAASGGMNGGGTSVGEGSTGTFVGGNTTVGGSKESSVVTPPPTRESAGKQGAATW